MMLAHRVKAAGYCNRVALGGPGLHLRMYHGWVEIVQGSRKNILALPYLFALAPLLVAWVLLSTLGWLVVAATGNPGLGLVLWLLVPPLMAEAHMRFTGRPVDLWWALWPICGLLVTAAIGLAFADRLRGVNRWRGRDVKLRAS